MKWRYNKRWTYTWRFSQFEEEVRPIVGLINDLTKDVIEDGEWGNDSVRVRGWCSSSEIILFIRSSSIDCLRSCLVNSFGARLSASLRITPASSSLTRSLKITARWNVLVVGSLSGRQGCEYTRFRPSGLTDPESSVKVNIIGALLKLIEISSRISRCLWINLSRT